MKNANNEKKKKIEKALAIKKKHLDADYEALEKIFERAEASGVDVDKAQFVDKAKFIVDMKSQENSKDNPEGLKKGNLPDIPESERVIQDVPVMENSEKIHELPVFYEEFVSKNEVPEYKERSNEYEVLQKFFDDESPMNVMIYSPAGQGKSLFLENFAKKNGASIIQADMSEDIRRSSIVGGLRQIGDETVWKHGIAGESIECANQNPNGHILVIEEGNQPRGEIQKLFNGLLDFRRSVYVAELGRYVRLRKGAKLFVVMTLNPAGDGYSGNEIEKSVDDRFGFQWKWSYPTIEECKKILGSYLDDIPKDFQNKIFKLVLEVQNLIKEGKVSDDISPRQQNSIFQTYKALKDIDGFERMVLEGSVLRQSMDDDERDIIKSRMESIFSSDVIGDDESESEEGDEFEN
jgi:MoxR-like ATPase